jgi:hypothetical protein
MGGARVGAIATTLDFARGVTHATGYDGFILRYENVVADFLISYHSSDQPWADWIAWVLQESRYRSTWPLLTLRATRRGVDKPEAFPPR